MPRDSQNQDLAPEISSFLEALPESARPLLESREALPESARPLLESRKGVDVVEEIGLDVVRGVVFDVMRGINIRDSTEPLTRRRISLLNAAMITQYTSLPGSATSVEALTNSIAETLERSRIGKGDEWMLNWALGLTDKGVQNVLRDDHLGLSGYAQRFLNTLRQTTEAARNDFGELNGTLRVGDKEVPLSWFFVLYLATSIGSQTLTIRGSEKSLYGKLFEKLVLGSVLHVLGFEYVPGTGPTDLSRRQYWMSTTEKRESDATLLIAPGKGVYFDIGFIGRGNPEIVLDKVSRFERTAEFVERRHGMVTFIIVDRIGARSRIEELATNIEGTVIQMSMSYWPQLMARRLHEKFDDYNDEIVDAEHERVQQLLQERLTSAPIESLLNVASPDPSESPDS